MSEIQMSRYWNIIHVKQPYQQIVSRLYFADNDDFLWNTWTRSTKIPTEYKMYVNGVLPWAILLMDFHQQFEI